MGRDTRYRDHHKGQWWTGHGKITAPTRLRARAQARGHLSDMPAAGHARAPLVRALVRELRVGCCVCARARPHAHSSGGALAVATRAQRRRRMRVWRR